MLAIEPTEFLALAKEYWTHITSIALLGNLLWKKYKYFLLGQDKAQVGKTEAEGEKVAAEAGQLMLKTLSEELAITRAEYKTSNDNLKLAGDEIFKLKGKALDDDAKHRAELAEKDAQTKKIIEEGLRIAQKLEHSEFLREGGQQAVRRLHQNAGLAYWVVTADGTPEYVSEEFYRFFGVETGGDWSANVLKEDHKRILHEFARLLKNRDSYAEMEFSMIDGRRAKSYYAIIPENTGDIHKIIGVTMQIK